MQKGKLVKLFILLSILIGFYLNNNEIIPENNSSESSQIYEVLEVVDGDTLKINYKGAKTSLRLIGINTPETKDPRKPVECFGFEASNKAKNILENSSISIEFDPTQDTIDKYGRPLVYVYLEDGTNFNKLMIEEGYAFEYTYNIPYKYQKEFKEAERQAEELGKGLWNKETCGGELKEETIEEFNENVVKRDEKKIKGNIGVRGKEYYPENCQYYESVKINEEKGEKYFDNIEEAEKEGFDLAKTC